MMMRFLLFTLTLSAQLAFASTYDIETLKSIDTKFALSFAELTRSTGSTEAAIKALENGKTNATYVQATQDLKEYLLSAPMDYPEWERANIEYPKVALNPITNLALTSVFVQSFEKLKKMTAPSWFGTRLDNMQRAAIAIQTTISSEIGAILADSSQQKILVDNQILNQARVVLSAAIHLVGSRTHGGIFFENAATYWLKAYYISEVEVPFSFSPATAYLSDKFLAVDYSPSLPGFKLLPSLKREISPQATLLGTTYQEALLMTQGLAD